VLLFSRHSMCRWLPPHHIQRGGCLQLAQTWSNCWHQGFVCLYPDCKMANARQFEHFAGLDVQVKVARKRGMLTVVVPSAGGRRVADICLTLLTSRQVSVSVGESGMIMNSALTSWRTVSLQNLAVCQMIKSSLALYGRQRRNVH
jgi:hypothetical protein